MSPNLKQMEVPWRLLNRLVIGSIPIFLSVSTLKKKIEENNYLSNVALRGLSMDTLRTTNNQVKPKE